ncbi:MAG TPA: methyltransferase [Longimicrobium sp.]|nr:methyltransferase [Longimicrobium sp.]
MPLTLPPEEHRALHETNEAPGPILDLLGGAALRVAGAASKLGVFEALAEGPRTAAAVAERAGTHPRGTALLLNALRVYGYVQASGENGSEAWTLTPVAERWMLRGKPGSFADTLEFWDSLLYGLWGELEKSVTTGAPPVDWYRWLEQNPKTLRTFQSMLGGIARHSAPEVVKAVELPAGAKRLVDVGGSHALFALEFLKAHEGLKAAVLDFPGALEIGRENAREAGMEDRVDFVACDFLNDDLGGGYDVALLASIVHGLSPEENVVLLKRLRAAMNPGGIVVVVEQTEGGSQPKAGVSEAFLRTFSLNMYHLQGAQTYAYEEIAAMLEEAGFTGPRMSEVRQSIDRVVQATNPG